MRINKQIVFLITLGVITSILDVVSISSIIPLGNLIYSPEAQEALKSYIGEFVFSNFIRTNENLITASVVLFVCGVIAVSIIRYASTKFRNYAIARVATSSSKAILNEYMSYDYDQYSKIDSSQVIGDVINKANGYAEWAVGSCVNAWTNSIALSIYVISFILIFGIEILVVISAIAIVYVIANVASKRIIGKISSENSANAVKAVSLVKEYWMDFIDIKMRGREESSIDNYNKINQQTQFNRARIESISQISRQLVEVLLILVVAAIMMSPEFGRQFTSNLPMLIAGAVILQKALPLMQGIYHSVLQYQANIAAIVEVRERLVGSGGGAMADHGTVTPPEDIHRIEAREVHVRSGSRVKLEAASLDMDRGEKIAITGPTGAGKSTLLRVIAGLERVGEGHLLVNDMMVASFDRYRGLIMPHVELVSQRPYIARNTIRTFVTEDSSSIDRSRLEKLYEVSRVNEVVARLPQGDITEIGENGVSLSGGELQRVALARALWRDRPIILFDEAFSAIDRAMKMEILSGLMALCTQKIIVSVTHNADELQFFKRIVILPGPEKS